MKTRWIIFFILTLFFGGLSASQSELVLPFSFLTAYDEEDGEDEEDLDDNSDTAKEDKNEKASSEDEGNEIDQTSSEDEEDVEEKKEEDPFKKESEDESKDEFVKEEVKKDAFAEGEDDFVQEKREKGKTHRYKEPDLAKISFPTYLYSENSIKSKKLFELYKNDEVVVIEENKDFIKVEFLGKEGWVPSQDIRLEKWHTYRISMELLGGAGSGGGDIENYSVLSNYHLRLNVSVLQDFMVGGEGRMIAFDADDLYAGGGVVLRYFIPGLRTKMSRTALTASVGYVGGMEKPGRTYEFQTGETQYKIFSGPYVDVSFDYFYRVWEYMDIGVGGYFSYTHLYGKTETADLEKSFYQGGAQLTLNFNILR